MANWTYENIGQTLRMERLLKALNVPTEVSSFLSFMFSLFSLRKQQILLKGIRECNHRVYGKGVQSQCARSSKCKIFIFHSCKGPRERASLISIFSWHHIPTRRSQRYPGQVIFISLFFLSRFLFLAFSFEFFSFFSFRFSFSFLIYWGHPY